MPSNDPKTPPRSMSPTSSTGDRAYRATRMLTMSPCLRFGSAGLPAPSITTRSCSRLSLSRAAVTCGHSSVFVR